MILNSSFGILDKHHTHINICCCTFAINIKYQNTLDFYAGRTWLNQMGAGAEQGGITIQYCMSLPREVLQSAEVSSVRRLRAR